MNFGRTRRREQAGIDLTPMIDCVFQLVLFLLVHASFEKREEGQEQSPGIQVDLPRSSAQAVISDDRDLNVWMALDGSIYLDDAPVTAAALAEAFSAAAARDDTTLVIIKADKGVAHGTVVRVMDLARAKGLSRLAIATQSDQL